MTVSPVGCLANEPSVVDLDAPPHPATPSHIITNDERHMLRFDTEYSWSSVRKNEKANSVKRCV
jgi:hypothetical protein